MTDGVTGAPVDGLVNGHISARSGETLSLQDLEAVYGPYPDFSPYEMRPDGVSVLYPRPEIKYIPEAVLTVNPSGIAVKKLNKCANQDKHGGGIRSEIYGRSSQSNRRLMNKLSRIDIEPVAALDEKQRYTRALFVTLTYPSEYPAWRESKENLRVWRERLLRKYGQFDWALWIQEFQRRGALHYHLILTFSSEIDRAEFIEWLSKSWYEVVGSGDEKHLRAGTQAVALHLGAGKGSLMSYLSKELSKGKGKSYQCRHIDHETGEVMPTGRTWGFWYEERVPYVLIAVATIAGLANWEAFKQRVSDSFKDSKYLSGVADLYEWYGALLYGDGLELLDLLLTGIKGVEFRDAA